MVGPKRRFAVADTVVVVVPRLAAVAVAVVVALAVPNHLPAAVAVGPKRLVVEEDTIAPNCRVAVEEVVVPSPRSVAVEEIGIRNFHRISSLGPWERCN